MKPTARRLIEDRRNDIWNMKASGSQHVPSLVTKFTSTSSKGRRRRGALNCRYPALLTAEPQQKPFKLGRCNESQTRPCPRRSIESTGISQNRRAGIQAKPSRAGSSVCCDGSLDPIMAAARIQRNGHLLPTSSITKKGRTVFTISESSCSIHGTSF
jgi:hypothetical protein